MSANPEENMKQTKRTVKAAATETPEQILARSEAKARVLGIAFAGSIAAVLALSGVVMIFVAPDRAKDVWLIVGPIITAAVSRMQGAWASNRRSRA
jgi:anti-sigma factor RsiW